ncbi:uncharacterized protein FYW47_012572 [Aplochiton taeniatus]
MKKQNRVSPPAMGHDNPGLELEMMGRVSRQISKTSVSGVVKAAAQWASYTASRWKRAARRQCVRRKLTGDFLESKYKGLAEDEDGEEDEDEDEEEEEEDGDVTDTARCKNVGLDKKLLDHFRELAASDQDSDEVDFQYVDNVITDGADPNAADKYGQTALHEISRAWNVDVMRFFLERGADVLRPDSYGVTPLHVAAALDYEEMILFLLDSKADIEARTTLDRQTPLHFAAKNDAVWAVRLLLQHGASLCPRDYKHRTALQLAANLGTNGDAIVARLPGSSWSWERRPE